MKNIGLVTVCAALAALSAFAKPSSPPPGGPGIVVRPGHSKPSAKPDGHHRPRPSTPPKSPRHDPPPMPGHPVRPQPTPPPDRGHSGFPHGTFGGIAGMRVVAEFNAGGGAKEVGYIGNSSMCVIEVLSGSVIINSVVIRKGAVKQSVVVRGRFEQGQHHFISLGDGVTGLRISDGGKGRYRVYVK